jgi:hypothetical protein
MPSCKPTPIYRPVVREALVLTSPVVFVAMLAGLVFGVIDKGLWGLLLAPTGLMVISIINSGCWVGQPIAARFRTNLSSGEVDVSHRSQQQREPSPQD